MNIQERSRIEYRSRINQVMDYIDSHLDQPLELKSIAEIANFSPFHFHRIFTFLIGETSLPTNMPLDTLNSVSEISRKPGTACELVYRKRLPTRRRLHLRTISQRLHHPPRKETYCRHLHPCKTIIKEKQN